jgi:hypothetical protein
MKRPRTVAKSGAYSTDTPLSEVSLWSAFVFYDLNLAGRTLSYDFTPFLYHPLVCQAPTEGTFGLTAVLQ